MTTITPLQAAEAEVTLTPEELRAAQEFYRKTYKAFGELWTAVSLIKEARREDSRLQSVCDADELIDMVIAQALRTASKNCDALSDLGFFLRQDRDDDLIKLVVANAHKDDGDEPTDSDATQ